MEGISQGNADPCGRRGASGARSARRSEKPSSNKRRGVNSNDKCKQEFYLTRAIGRVTYNTVPLYSQQALVSGLGSIAAQASSDRLSSSLRRETSLEFMLPSQLLLQMLNAL